jgi:penicillin amidase
MHQISDSAHQARVSDDPSQPTTVEAASWADAAFGLGWCMARDRGSQLEILRRTGHGRLAELIGPAGLANDVRQRRLDLAGVAAACWQLLPAGQRAILEAFRRGVDLRTGLAPDAGGWRVTDSLAVAQLFFQSLSSDGGELRMTEVMRRTMPAAAVDFLLAGVDEFGTAPDGSALTEHGPDVPLDTLRSLFAMPGSGPGRLVVADTKPVGSNAWAASGPAGTVLANDMHLQLSDPSLLYPVRLVLSGRAVAGVTVPGLPVVIGGSNGTVAWGFTRLQGDTVDLRELEPGQTADSYLVEGDQLRLQVRTETIKVRGASDTVLRIPQSCYGPVTGKLAGRSVAFESTLTDPRALDLAVLGLYEANSCAQALDIVNASGLPPVNAIVADAAGTIGWTVGGRFPVRDVPGPRGFSQSASKPVPAAWVPPGALPRQLSTGPGYLVNCNNGAGAIHASGLAWNLSSGNRARRVANLLADGAGAPTGPPEMLEVQRDVDASFFEFYRDLALRYLPRRPANPQLREIRADLVAWTGTAGVEEVGLALLVAFRDLLREEMFAAATRPAQDFDPDYQYCLNSHEWPLRTMLGLLDEGLLPAPWPSPARFVLGQLLIGRSLLCARFGADRLPRWGETNRLNLARASLRSSQVPDFELAGCAESVRVAQPDFGAAMRLVVSLDHPEQSLLSMPGGPVESSRDNAEHVRRWIDGQAQPLWSAAALAVLAGSATRSGDGQDLEELIFEVWTRVLESSDFEPDDGFFEAGGDSVLMLEVHSLLQDALPDRPISAMDLFRYPTIPALAGHLRRSADRAG